MAEASASRLPRSRTAWRRSPYWCDAPSSGRGRGRGRRRRRRDARGRICQSRALEHRWRRWRCRTNVRSPQRTSRLGSGRGACRLRRASHTAWTWARRAVACADCLLPMQGRQSPYLEMMCCAIALGSAMKVGQTLSGNGAIATGGALSAGTSAETGAMATVSSPFLIHFRRLMRTRV